MTVFISTAFLLIFGALFYSFQPLFVFTKRIAEWCQSLFLQCLEYILIAKFFFLWFGFAILAVWFAYAVLRGVFALFTANRKIKALPISDCGGIIIIEDNRLKTAFTHGILKPKIYMSRGLINSLDDSELKAVYLHELHHKNQRDPLRLFLISILKDTLFYIPISRFIEGLIQRKIEFAADDAVVNDMCESVSLAAALLKITDFNNGRFMPQPASLGGFGSTEGRIRRLIEGTGEVIKLPSMKSAIISILIFGLLLFSLAFPLFASFPEMGRCDTSHCAIHINKLGADCMSHCETSKKHSH
jgi:hypothetical protein